MKQVIEDDHVPIHNFKMLVIGLLGPPYLTFTSITGIEESMETENLPDLTVATLGRSNPVEFSTTLPQHHRLEQAAMEGWLFETRDPISPLYKKPVVLTMSSLSGSDFSYIVPDAFPYKRTLASLDMGDAGTMAVVTWSFRGSAVVPLLIT